MKIDDPRVQEYIKGQLTSEEEAALLVELEAYPEVADLAETLKRTQALIDEDINQGTVPELAKTTAQPKGLERTFKPMLGKNWRFELAILSGGVTVLLLILVGIPLIKSLQDRTSQQNQNNQFEDSLADKDNTEGTEPSIRVVHEAESSALGKGYSTPEQMQDFETSLISKKAQKLREAESHFVELTKQMSMPPAEKDRLLLPVQVDVDLGYEMRAALKEGKLLSQDQVGVAELVNSFEPSSSAEFDSAVRLRSYVLEAPWDSREQVLVVMTEVSPNLEKTLSENRSRAIVFLGASPSVVEKLGQDVSKPIYTDLEVASQSLTSQSQGEELQLVVFVWRTFTAGESLLLSRWVKKDGAHLSIVDTTASQSSVIRKEIGPEVELNYISAPTPVLLKKAFYNYQSGSGDPIRKVKLEVSSKQDSVVAQLRGSQAFSASLDDHEFSKHNWLFAGEKISSVIKLSDTAGFSAPAELPDFEIEAKISYQQRHDQAEKSIEKVTSEISAPKEAPVDLVRVLSLDWLGRILKGQRPMRQSEFRRLKEFAVSRAPAEISEFIASTEKLYF